MSEQDHIAAIYQLLAQLPQESFFTSFQAGYQDQDHNHEHTHQQFDQLIPCPGLNFLNSSSYEWYSVEGYNTGQRTICGQCKTNCDIDCIYTRLTGSANCDSYYYSNKADNGIFNYSIWSSNKKICYNSNETGDVEFLSSDKFHLLISGYTLKENQYYTYKIYRNGELILSSPANTFYRSTELISDFYFLNKKVPYNYLKNNCIFGSGDCLKIDVEVHKLVFKDPFLKQGDLGNVILENGIIYTNKTGFISEGYDPVKISKGLPLNYEMEPFTHKPISYSFNFNCNTEQGFIETQKILVDNRLHVLKSRLVIYSQELELNKINSKLCKDKILEIENRISDITKDISDLRV